MMDRIIRHITEDFVARLPQDDQSYRLKDLEQYDFPDFLIRRIYLELIWNLDESMQPPKTDWADTQSETVQQAWQSFLEAIQAQARLPQSYAKAIVETAVADIMDMLVQPRKNITGLLFGGEDQLSAADLHERTDLLVVYAHFSRVIERYLNRKQKDELSRERCQKIILQVDGKVTANYTPLQWAQMLDPLFTLAGPQVETDLFRLFFEDREMHRTARTFDMMDDQINRATFIEVLSSPEMLNYDGYEEDQSELFGEEKKANENTNDEDSSADKEEERNHKSKNTATENISIDTDGEERDQKKPRAEDTDAEPMTVEEETPEVEDETEGEADESEEETQARNDVDQESSDHERVEESAEVIEEEESASLNDIFVADDEPSEASQTETASVIDESDPDEEEQEATIWSRFMDSEESDGTERSPGRAEVQTQNEPSEHGLHTLFSDNESYYIEELFGGSETAYNRSLNEIAQCTSWKVASKLIRKDIFERNEVDIYSEAALEFTDRLQTYFMEKNNHK